MKNTYPGGKRRINDNGGWPREKKQVDIKKSYVQCKAYVYSIYKEVVLALSSFLLILISNT